MRLKAKAATLLAAIVLMTIALGVAAPLMAPVQPGRSAVFWQFACGVALGGSDQGLGGTHLPRDGRAIYYHQGFHGEVICSVPLDAVAADMPKVLSLIEEHASHANASPLVKRAQIVVNTHEEAVRTNVIRFLTELHNARLQALHERNPGMAQSLTEHEESFSIVWNRAKRYWINVAFEWLLLTGLLGLIAWPWLRRSSPILWAACFGLFPFFFFLPVYLGYATFTFTSAGPSGGALYPLLLMPFGRTSLFPSIDGALASYFPPLLQSVSQEPFGPMSLSGMRFPGPLTTIVCGMVVATCAYFTRRFIGRKQTD